MTNEEYIAGLHEFIQGMAADFLANAAVNGLDLRITAGYRSIEEQDALYAQGRTKPGQVVTNARGGQSLHNFGLAFDVVDRKHGYDIDWSLLGAIAESVGLEHGDRGYVDKPHFQHMGGLTLEEIQRGERPTSNDYNMTQEEREVLQRLVALKHKFPFRMVEGSGKLVFDSELGGGASVREAASSALGEWIALFGIPMISKKEAKEEKYTDVK